MKRLSYIVALVASLTLVVDATATLAATHPDNRATHGPGAVTLEQSDDVVRPDDRATHGPGLLTSSQTSGAVRPDDRATHGQGAVLIEQLPGAGPFPAIGSGETKAVRVDGFDWVDAAIGAAAALGLGLIVAGGVALALRRAQEPAYL